MADLGLANVNSPQLTIYVKYYIPFQSLPPTITKAGMTDFGFHVLVERQATTADTIRWVSEFFGLFGANGAIIGAAALYLSGKDSSSSAQNVGKEATIDTV